MFDARVKQNITEKELSKITGVTQADISRIENGTRNPSLAVIQRLASGLGLKLCFEVVKNNKKLRKKILDGKKVSTEECIDIDKVNWQ